LRLRFLVGEQFLCGLFDLFEQAPVVASLIDGRLQLFAQLGESLEPLLVREILVQRVFESHRVSAGSPQLVIALNHYQSFIANAIPKTFTGDRPAGHLRLHCK